MKAPRRGVRSPPRLELSGSEPSHEPQSRSVNSSKKATPQQTPTEEAANTAAAKPGVSVEGMREEIPTEASDGALLQRGMPTKGTGVVALEKPSTVAAVGEWSAKAATTKHPPSGTLATGWTCAITPETGARGSSQDTAANFFFGDSCDRPGCYERFERTQRSPLQRFCSQECRRALERVLERDRRWRQRAQVGTAEAKQRTFRSVSQRR
jgi:hypothetical protein